MIGSRSCQSPPTLGVGWPGSKSVAAAMPGPLYEAESDLVLDSAVGGPTWLLVRSDPTESRLAPLSRAVSSRE